MSDVVYPAMVIVTWVALGVGAVVAFLARHGRRSWQWYLIGVVLGPILLPIAAEMDRRVNRLGHWTTPTHGTGAATGWSALVAVDGSAESDRALDALVRLAPGSARIHLLHVLDPDRAGSAEVESAHSMLEQRATRVSEVEVVQDVASGDPARVILKYADDQAVDVVVVGRRGHGLSTHVLGSVSDHVVRGARRPVLLGAPPLRDR